MLSRSLRASPIPPTDAGNHHGGGRERPGRKNRREARFRRAVAPPEFVPQPHFNSLWGLRALRRLAQQLQCNPRLLPRFLHPRPARARGGVFPSRTPQRSATPPPLPPLPPPPALRP